MTTILAFIKRRRVPTYFVLALAISWGCILAAVGPGGVMGKGAVWVAGPISVLGPSIAGILMTVLVYGKAGLRDLLSRLIRWRVSARWYGIALLTSPLLTLAILLAFSLSSPAFLPTIITSDDRLGLVLYGLVAGLLDVFFEELGWTGFATPELRKHYGFLTTGLILGLAWGLWHLPLFLGSAISNGALSPYLFLTVLLFSVLPPYRILMGWVYDRTQSLLLAMLMHMPLVAVQVILIPAALSGASMVAYDLVSAAVLWAFVAAVVIAKRRQLVSKVSLAR